MSPKPAPPDLAASPIFQHSSKFAPDGMFLTSFGRLGSGPGEFEYPMAVAVTADGTVFVTDFGNNRVQKWRQP
jgi:DNA-binding beta-propeller fold protein YncE